MINGRLRGRGEGEDECEGAEDGRMGAGGVRGRGKVTAGEDDGEGKWEWRG